MFKILHLASGNCVKAVRNTDFEVEKIEYAQCILDDEYSSIINLNGLLKVVNRDPSPGYAMRSIPKHEFEVVWFD